MKKQGLAVRFGLAARDLLLLREAKTRPGVDLLVPDALGKRPTLELTC